MHLPAVASWSSTGSQEFSVHLSLSVQGFAATVADRQYRALWGGERLMIHMHLGGRLLSVPRTEESRDKYGIWISV